MLVCVYVHMRLNGVGHGMTRYAVMMWHDAISAVMHFLSVMYSPLRIGFSLK